MKVSSKNLAKATKEFSKVHKMPPLSVSQPSKGLCLGSWGGQSLGSQHFSRRRGAGVKFLDLIEEIREVLLRSQPFAACERQ